MVIKNYKFLLLATKETTSVCLEKGVVNPWLNPIVCISGKYLRLDGEYLTTKDVPDDVSQWYHLPVIDSHMIPLTGYIDGCSKHAGLTDLLTILGVIRCYVEPRVKYEPEESDDLQPDNKTN